MHAILIGLTTTLLTAGGCRAHAQLGISIMLAWPGCCTIYWPGCGSKCVSLTNEGNIAPCRVCDIAWLAAELDGAVVGTFTVERVMGSV